jgi:hypothetical protein
MKKKMIYDDLFILIIVIIGVGVILSVIEYIVYNVKF